MWDIGIFLGGLVLLVIGGRFLVSASVDTATRLRISPLVVGLTLVAWGTSTPELALNLVSALKGRSDLALGNVVGANISNMAVVLGVCALIRPLLVGERLIRVELWLNALVAGFMVLLGATVGFSRWSVGGMLLIFGIYSFWTIRAAMRASARQGDMATEPTHDAGGGPSAPPMGWWMIACSFAGGLVLLSIGGSLASDGASKIALDLGVPPAIVGVTIVSIGTTTPELVTSVMAMRRGQTDLAMGNALGSCLFNAGAVLGLSGLISPPAVDRTFLLPMAYMVMLACVIIPMSHTHARTVSRMEGAILLTSYVAFLVTSAWLVMGR